METSPEVDVTDEGTRDKAGSGENGVVDITGDSVMIGSNDGDAMGVVIAEIAGSVVMTGVVEIVVDVLVGVLTTAVDVLGAVVDGVFAGDVESGTPQIGS